MIWEMNENKKSNMILDIAYGDFATIKIEKKVNNKGISFYEVEFHIEEVTDQTITTYSLKEITSVLENAKNMIEDLFDDIEEYSQKDLYDWLEDFCETINNY